MRLIHKRFGVAAGFFVLLLLLAINAAVLRHQLAVQIGNQEGFSHSKRVSQELRNSESLLKDAEIGQRGFLYTGKPDYLTRYRAAASGIDSHLQTLSALIGNDPTEQTRASLLGFSIHQKLARLTEEASVFAAGDPAGARAMVMSDRDVFTTRDIGSLFSQMEQEESLLSDARKSAYQSSIRITFACIYVASAIAALGLVLLALATVQEMKRREADAASLRRSEEWFRVTLSSIGDGIIATNAWGEVSFLNPVAERLTGVNLEAARNRNVSDIFPTFSEATKKPMENPVEKVLALGSVVGLTTHSVLRHQDGHFLPIEDSAAPIKDDSGKLIGVVLVFHDATRERNFQEVLRRTEKLAAAARLAATVAHEINNPLEAVGNLIFLARTNRDATGTIKEQLHLAEQELARVSHITRQTLGFYRESVLPTAVHIPTLVESALKLYSNKLQMKGIRLQLALEECPPTMGLAGEIQQLVSNIISNAIDALPVNGVLTIDASLTRVAGSESILLKIEDNGTGISQENLKRIFEPFFTTKKDVGTGLGLWVCKEIAERHGGTVQAHSKVEQGSSGAVFTILLPYQAVTHEGFSLETQN